MNRSTLEKVKKDFFVNMGLTIVQSQLHLNPFLSQKQLYDRAVQELNDGFDRFYARITKGVEVLRREVPPHDGDRKRQFLVLFSELDNFFVSLKISSASVSVLYKLGKDLINTGKLRDARDLFLFSAIFAPDCPEIWLAMGMVEQLMQQFEQALAMYSQVILLDPECSISYLFSAECHLNLKDPVKAKDAFEIAKSHIQNLPEKEHLLPRIEILGRQLSS